MIKVNSFLQRELLNRSFNWIIKLFTKENGTNSKIYVMVEEFRYGPMEADLMATGKMEWLMEKAVLFMYKVMFTRATGLKIKLKVMVFTKLTKEANTKEIGTTMHKMEKVLKNGLMEAYTKATIKMDLNTVKER